MKQNESNFLIYGLILGGILSTGLVIFLSRRFINKFYKNKSERKHKFYEGIDDIFDSSPNSSREVTISIDKETEDGIIDELFSRTN